MPRGGYQQPSPEKRAPVSGPGALSRRTDGTQPVRVAPGGAHGTRQALEQQQQAAPLPDRTGAAPTGTPPGPGGAAPPTIHDPFAPTRRPGEPITAGVNAGPGPGRQQPLLPEDPYEAVRALIQANPHPDLIALLRYAT